MFDGDALRREEFLSDEDLDLQSLSWDELIAYWNLWLHQAQASNEWDADDYSHGVFVAPEEARRLIAEYYPEESLNPAENPHA